MTRKKPISDAINKVAGEVKLDDVKKETISGIGDIIAKITKGIGIEPCDSCEKRRKALNDMFSFLRAAKRELTTEELEWISEINRTNKVSDSGKFFRMYNDVFGVHAQTCNCPPIIKEMLFKLNKVVERQEIKDDINQEDK